VTSCPIQGSDYRTDRRLVKGCAERQISTAQCDFLKASRNSKLKPFKTSFPSSKSDLFPIILLGIFRFYISQVIMAVSRILIVDDDKLVLETLSRILIREGWDVDICSRGEQALEHVSNHSYQCILLDVRMPGLTGTDVLERFRSLETQGKLQRQRIIFISGFADDAASVKAFGLGADHWLQKPVELRQLLEKINLCINAQNSMSGVEEQEQTIDKDSLKKIRKSYERADVDKKADILAQQLNIDLKHIKGCSYETNLFKGNIENPFGIIQIPLGVTGPVLINGNNAKGEFYVPMATTEGALLLTYDLGMRLASMCGGIKSEVLSKVVHITPMFPIHSDEDNRVGTFVDQTYEMIKEVAESGSHHTKLLGIEQHTVGKNFLLKFKYDTGDAQGLNMINQASFNACKYIESKTGASFFHRSHYSGVKHHSPLNEKEGYGRRVKASLTLSSKALAMMRVTAVEMKDFFDRCIECGQASGIGSVNVHAANAITAIYLACGQDAADISSSHVCATTTQLSDDGKNLTIVCELKNLLVATVGGGTVLPTQQECLRIMSCAGSGKSDKFAEIVAATVLAGEFPTAAAVITRTYVDIHNKYGRNKSPK